MARLVGKTASGAWWFLGALCVMLLGGRPASGQIAPMYGVVPRPPVKPVEPPVVDQQVDAEDLKKAQALVEKYLAPVDAREPNEEQKKAIDAAMVGLKGGAENADARDAAMKTLRELGPVALGALREAAKPDNREDRRLAMSARALVRQIEEVERQKVVVALRAVGQAPATVAAQKAATESAAATQDCAAKVKAANEANDPAALAKARTEMAAAVRRGQAAQTLLFVLQNRESDLQPMQTKYGIAPPAQVRYGIQPLK